MVSPVGGIPDIYEGHPEARLLVETDDSCATTETLYTAIRKVAVGNGDPDAIRAHYCEGFDIATAHRNWIEALGLSRSQSL